MLQVRDQQRDGYDAVQLGFMDKSRSKATRAERGHVSAEMESKRRRKRGGLPLAPKANCEPQRYIKEFRLEGPTDIKVGAILTATEVFKKIKKKWKRRSRSIRPWTSRHVQGPGHHGRDEAAQLRRPAGSHGVKKDHRSPGSIGS